MKNWKRILQLLKELETHKDFYRRSLNRVSVNPTPENAKTFWADAKVLNDAEKELHRLTREA
jgi:Flp pilus assembly CpaE family ATPase